MKGLSDAFKDISGPLNNADLKSLSPELNKFLGKVYITAFAGSSSEQITRSIIILTQSSFNDNSDETDLKTDIDAYIKNINDDKY